jgi:hypothetical protein
MVVAVNVIEIAAKLFGMGVAIGGSESATAWAWHRV